jgi:hypothetical protein
MAFRANIEESLTSRRGGGDCMVPRRGALPIRRIAPSSGGAMLSNRMRVGATGLVLAGLGLLAAACGGSPDGGTPTPASSENAFAAYTDCLAKNGVTLPSGAAGDARGGPRASGRPSGRPTARPSGSPGRSFGAGGFGGGGLGGLSSAAPAGVDAATWQKAQQACQSVRPTAGPDGGGFGGGGANNSALTAYRNCLSEHGVTATAGTAGLNTADPTVAAAITACAPLRPTARPNPTPTPAS